MQVLNSISVVLLVLLGAVGTAYFFALLLDEISSSSGRRL